MLNRGTNRAKELVRSSLNRVGLDLVRFPAPHTIAHDLQKFLLQEGINLILDVGAYHGSYCALLREKAGYRGRIVSFEPHRNSFDILNAGMADDENWQGYGFGISDNDRTATLNVYEGRGDFNSLLDLREQGAAAYDVDASRRSAERVQMHTLDSLWPRLVSGIDRPRVFLKIDTQGHDTAVVRGAANNLKDIRGIQSELPVIELYDGMTPMPAALTFYRDLGYVPIGFFPVNTPAAYAASPEFDVLLKQLRNGRDT